MNPIYQQALNGTLSSPGGVASSQNLLNVCMISVDILRCNSDTTLTLVQTLSPNATVNANSWAGMVNDYYVIQSTLTGAFMMVVQLLSNSTDPVDISQDMLCNPNDIGEIPQPSQNFLLPPNTPGVVVGIGLLPGSQLVITREQFWARSGDSYSLGPGETREISFTQTSGMQNTSSSQDVVNKSINASGSVGWGPFSASVSAALSSSSTTMQQVSVTEESTSYVAQKFYNAPGEESVMVLKWELTDTIYGFSITNNYAPSFSVQTVQTPVAISSLVASAIPAGETAKIEVQSLQLTDDILAQELKIKKLARARQMEQLMALMPPK